MREALAHDAAAAGGRGRSTGCCTTSRSCDLARRVGRGVEALVRWQDPNGGIVPPGEFIPLAEEMGLIEAIGDWVIDEMAAQQRAWRERRARPARSASTSRRVSCGGAPRGEGPREAARRPTSTLARSSSRSPSPRRWPIPDRTQRILSELHAWGLTLAIDDFGTGYSSLARLKHLPVDILKIDRSFVRDVRPRHAASPSMVRAMIQLAQRPRHDAAGRGDRDARRARVPAGERLLARRRASTSRSRCPPRRSRARRREERGLHARRRPARSACRPPSGAGGPLPSARPCAGGTTRARSSRSGSRSGTTRASTGPRRIPPTPGRASTRSTCSRTPRATCTWATPRRSAAATPSPGTGAMRGYNVLHPIGWDAFGLPAENAAIKRGIHPKEWTVREHRPAGGDRSGAWACRSTGRGSSGRAIPSTTGGPSGCSCGSSSGGWPTGRTSPVNWCPNDQTVLANEQVIQGACERCGTMVERRDLTQWFFKITDYAQRLLDDMDQLDGVARTRADDAAQLDRPQRGRRASRSRSRRPASEVEVFTTRPDTLWGVTFFVFSVEHPLVEQPGEARRHVGRGRAADRAGRAATPLTCREAGRHEGRRVRSACTRSTR